MTLTELRYIVALEQTRHFGRAAEQCFVSQPTLSVAVRKLEDQLDLSLFERQRGEVRPTAAGEKIIAQARRVLAEVEQLRAIAQAGLDPLRGELKLGAIFTVAPYLLPALVPKLRNVAPQMPLMIEENYTHRLRKQLLEHQLDLIIVAEPFSGPGIRTWPLYDEDFVIALPPGHRWSRRASIPADELAGENLLLLGSGHCFSDQVVAACPECLQFSPDRQPMAGSSLETIRHMVASGLGVTVLPSSAMRASDDQLLCIRPFSAPVPRRRIVLAWREEFPRIGAIETVRHAVLDSAMPHVCWLPDSPVHA